MTGQRLAVVGYGSVGRRHAANALALGCNVVLVRRQSEGNDLGLPEVRSLEDADVDAVVIATPTALHADTLQRLGSRSVAVLCEKPLCATREQADRLAPLAARIGTHWRVALQLRYHPLVETVLGWIADDRVGAVRYVDCAVGQYLPDWRPTRNHLQTYSASAAAGGGVLLDLVHEVDLATCLAGPARGAAVGMSRRVGDVTVDADDVADVVWVSERGAMVHVHVDYLFRGLLRETLLVCANGSIRLNLAAGSVTMHGSDGREIERREAGGLERNEMFVALLREFLAGIREPSACRLPTAEEHLRLQASLWSVLHHDKQVES